MRALIGLIVNLLALFPLAMSAAATGPLAVLGSFTQANVAASPVGAARFALYDARSNMWTPLGAGVGSRTGDVAIAIASHGGLLYVGGALVTAVGNGAATGLVRWDGYAWSGVGDASGGPNGNVAALVVYRGDLIIGGEFTAIGVTAVSRIARWNGNEVAALASGVGAGTNVAVYALAVYQDKLIAAGKFAQMGGVAVNNIAQWDGAAWSALGTGSSALVSALFVDNGLLYVGSVPSAPTSVNKAVTIWSGTAWTAPTAQPDNTVRCFARYSGRLVMAGYFAKINKVAYGRVAVYDGSSGGTWSALGGGVNGDVNSMTVYADGLIVGGDFTAANGNALSARGLARWDGATWQAYGNGVNGGVWALLPLPDGAASGAATGSWRADLQYSLSNPAPGCTGPAPSLDVYRTAACSEAACARVTNLGGGSYYQETTCVATPADAIPAVAAGHLVASVYGNAGCNGVPLQSTVTVLATCFEAAGNYVLAQLTDGDAAFSVASCTSSACTSCSVSVAGPVNGCVGPDLNGAYVRVTFAIPPTPAKGGLSGGAVAGIVLGILGVVVALGAVGYWVYSKRRSGDVAPIRLNDTDNDVEADHADDT